MNFGIQTWYKLKSSGYTNNQVFNLFLICQCIQLNKGKENQHYKAEIFILDLSFHSNCNKYQTRFFKKIFSEGQILRQCVINTSISHVLERKTNVHGRRHFTDLLKSKYLGLKAHFQCSISFYYDQETEARMWPCKAGFVPNKWGFSWPPKQRIYLSFPSDIPKHAHRYFFTNGEK